MQRFDHEKLDVYQAAVEFVALADDVVENLPRGRAYQSACAKQNDGLLSHTGFHDEILDPGVFKLNRKAISSLVLTAGYP